MSAWLPIPESLGPELTAMNFLPLAHLPADFQLLVLTDPRKGEWVFTSGSALHSNWESSEFHRFDPGALQVPSDSVSVECPDGTLLTIRITDYSRVPRRQIVTKLPSGKRIIRLNPK